MFNLNHHPKTVKVLFYTLSERKSLIYQGAEPSSNNLSRRAVRVFNQAVHLASPTASEFGAFLLYTHYDIKDDLICKAV